MSFDLIKKLFIGQLLLTVIVQSAFAIAANSEYTTHGQSATRAENSTLDGLPFYDFRTYREADLLYRASYGDLLPERPGYEIVK